MKRILYASRIAVILLCCASFGLACLKDTLIVYRGVRSYNAISTVVYSSTLAFAIVSIALTVVAAVTSKRDGDSRVDEHDFEESKNNMKEQKKILESVSHQLHHKWKDTKVQSKTVKVMQTLDEMVGYQLNVQSLLEHNSTDGISDATDMLEKLEVAMYTNLKKLNNYLISMSVSDLDFVYDKAKACYKINLALLEQTKEFVVAVTDYINNGMKQDDRSLYLVQSYKETILETIDDASTYLT